MNGLEYILVYDLYCLVMILIGIIWLKGTNSPNSKRFVHHYQVGIFVLFTAIPLNLFVVIVNDLLGVHLLIIVYILAFGSIIADYKDVIAIMNEIGFLFFKTKW